MADVVIFSRFHIRHVCAVETKLINTGHETGVVAMQNVPLSYRASYYSKVP